LIAKYRHHLPQLDGRLFLTDGGIETTLLFHERLELPFFAAFHLLRDDKTAAVVRDYYHRHASIARNHGVGFVLESPTWRASSDWGAKLGYTEAALAEANARAVAMLHDLRRELETVESPMVISGCVGPRGDGYRPETVMSTAAAEAYHSPQIDVLAASGVDLVSAVTMTNSAEATGVVRAARNAGVPAVISFTVETDGRLPSGERLGSAIEAVDASTASATAYFKINCAHPTHFFDEMIAGGEWVKRIRGLRANASRRSHAELDEATTLDEGDPVDLGARYRALRERFPHLNVLGGCCGTDHRHIEQICVQCVAAV
jgi:S-methylmethionine-dependent homocysteine/selenocysteine methylase